MMQINKTTILLVITLFIGAMIIGGQLSLTFFGQRSQYKDVVKENKRLQDSLKLKDAYYLGKLQTNAKARQHDLELYNQGLRRADSINVIRARELLKHKRELQKYNNHTVKQLEDEAKRVYLEYMSADTVRH